MTDIFRGLEIYLIKPEERTNLVVNPSVEVDTTGYTPFNSTIARSVADSRYGIASLKVTPVDTDEAGAYYSVALTTGVKYHFSASIKGAAGITYRIAIQDDTGMMVEAGLDFVANGHWQRKYVTFTADESDTFYLAVVRLEAQDDTTAFYLDGFQLEVGDYPTTFICGDNEIMGMVDTRDEYYWTGAPNASTSIRKWWTQSGGQMLRLRDYCRLAKVEGLGLPGVQPLSVKYTLGGAGYQWSRPGSRLIMLTLDFYGDNPGDIATKIAAIADAVNITNTMHNQLLRLMIVGYNSTGAIEGSDVLFVDVAYRAGLEGSLSSYRHERKTIAFEQYSPSMIGEGWSASALSWQQDLSGYCVVRERHTGVIDNFEITTAADGQGNVLVKDSVGTYYLGGLYGNLNGGTYADYITKYTPSGGWDSIDDDTLNGEVLAAVIDNNDRLYIGGSFTNAGGKADADYIAYAEKDGKEFLQIVSSGNPCNGAVYALAMSRLGTIYIGGAFTDISGTGADYLARYDGTTVAVVKSATALNGAVRCIIPDPWGDGVIVGGAFTSAGGTSGLNYIARVTVSGSAYDYVSITDVASPNGAIYAIHWDEDLGRLYVMGDFSTIGGITANRIAYWDGSNWRAMGTGFNALNAPCGMVSEHGKLHCACNGAAYAGGVALPDAYAIWDGNQWMAPMFDISGAASSRNIFYDKETDDVFYLGPVAGTTTEAPTTITVNGYADVYPVLSVIGPGTIYGIKSYKTGQKIYFNGLTLLAGEEITFVFTRTGYKIYSNRRGRLQGYRVPGGSTTFRLEPGVNKIGMFIYGSTSAATTAVLRWRESYLAFEQAVYTV